MRECVWRAAGWLSTGVGAQLGTVCTGQSGEWAGRLDWMAAQRVAAVVSGDGLARRRGLF